MKASFLTPFPAKPEICVGAVIDLYDPISKRVEYAPIILPAMLTDDVLAHGPMWLISHLAEPFMVFFTMPDAENFLYTTFDDTMNGTITPDSVEAALTLYRGEVRFQSEYGASPEFGTYNPN